MRNKKYFITSFMVTFMAAFIATGYIMYRQTRIPEVTLSEIRLTDLDNKNTNLMDYAGKPTVVNLWATWCAPCREEFPDFQELHNEYQDKVHFIMVSDEDQKTILNFKQKNPYKFTYLRLGSGFENLTARPVTLVYDSKGVLVKKILGSIHKNELKLILDGLESK